VGYDTVSKRPAALVIFAASVFAMLALLLLVRPAAADGISITGITPSKGPADAETLLVIQGTGFPTPEDCEGSLIQVEIGGTGVFPIELPTSTQVRVVAPAHGPGPVDVTVKNLCDGTSDTVEDGYTYVSPGIVSGGVPDVGFGLFVFSGGTSSDLVEAVDCDSPTLTFWATDEDGNFVTFIPGTVVGAANAPWYALFPNDIPANTALIGRCR
jgi:hypothetical protein